MGLPSTFFFPQENGREKTETFRPSPPSTDKTKSGQSQGLLKLNCYEVKLGNIAIHIFMINSPNGLLFQNKTENV